MKDFLYIENESVKASKAILQVPAFRQFYKETITNPSEKKTQLFKDYITYIYYVYKLSSQFGSDDYSYLNNKSIEEREMITIEDHLEGRYELKTLKKDKTLQALIDDYNAYCKPSTELLRDQVFEDIDSLIRSMSAVPNTIVADVVYDIPEEQRKPGVPFTINKKVYIPNTKAKNEVYSSVEKLLNLKEKYDKIVFKEKITQQKGQSKKYQFEENELSFNFQDLNQFGDIADVDVGSVESIYGAKSNSGDNTGGI